MGHAACSPGVQVAIGEDYVGNMAEVFIGVPAAESIQSPIELRSQPVSRLALGHVGIGGVELRVEHVCLSVLVNWHDHLIADLVVPAVKVEAILAKAILAKAYLGTIHVSCRVLENIQNDSQTAEELSWGCWVCEIPLSPRACCVHWVSRERSNKVSSIWVIDHLHVSHGPRYQIGKVTGLCLACYWLAGLESLGHCIEIFRVSLRQELEASS